MALENWEGQERDFEKGLMIKERDVQKQTEESKIRETRYNVRYKDWSECINRPRYLEDMDEMGVEKRWGLRAMVRLTRKVKEVSPSDFNELWIS